MRATEEAETTQIIISTHAPAGGATRRRMQTSGRPSLFLLTPLREGRLRGAARSGSRAHISTHAPAGGATERPARITPSPTRFLLTPLREGRLYAVKGSLYYSAISTHAPAGGATLRSGQCKPMQLRFLLTPLREGRRGLQVGRKGGSHFYSRPCGRGDKRGGRKGKFGAISTHAPAGGATRGGMRQNESHENFYSRPCGRGDGNFPQVRHEVLRQIAER